MTRDRAAEAYTNSVTFPIYNSASYYFKDRQEVIDGLHRKTLCRGRYGRYDNPSWLHVEQELSTLNGADSSLLFASGMAAHFTAFMTFLKSGDHVVLPAESYRQVRNLFLKVLPKFGVNVHVFSIKQPDYFLEQLSEIRDRVRLVHLEMPSSPHMYLIDLEEVRRVVGREVIVTIDSSFAPPPNFFPLAYGCDLSICSGTKYLSGHGDLVVGAISGNLDLIERIRWYRDTTGAITDGRVADLLSRSLCTLELRLARVNETAQRVAEFLSTHPRVERVLYTGLETHPHRILARKYLRGHGGVVTFDLKENMRGTADFVDRLKVPFMASNFGAPQTLVEQSAFFTYFEYSEDELKAIGVRHGTVRLAIGYADDAQEVIRDLEAALGRK